MKKLLLTTAIVTLTCASAQAGDRLTCSGKIGTYFAGHGADRSIGSGDNMCYFVSTSDIGKRILSTCPVGTTCRISADVVNDRFSSIITKLYSVGRVGK
jgi:hypothetical protein